MKLIGTIALLCACMIVALSPATGSAGLIDRLLGLEKTIDSFEKDISDVNSITEALLIFRKNGIVLNKNYVLWLDTDLRDYRYFHPKFVGKICNKFGGRLYKTDAAGKPSVDQFMAKESGDEWLGEYTCDDNEGKALFDIALRRKSSSFFRSTNSSRPFGDVVARIYAQDNYNVSSQKSYQEIAEEFGRVDILSFAKKKKVSIFDRATTESAGPGAVKVVVPIAMSVNVSTEHVSTVGMWSKFLSQDVPMFCRVRGGEFFKIWSDLSLQPFSEVLYVTPLSGSGTQNLGTRVREAIIGDYACVGGTHPFSVKTTRIINYMNRDDLEAIFSTDLRPGIASLPVISIMKSESKESPVDSSIAASSEPAAGIPSESSVSEAQRSYKNEPDGFRSLKWGQDIASLKDMIPTRNVAKQHACYVRKGDSLKIGEAHLKSIEYCFWSNKLWYVQGELQDYLGEFKKLEQAFIIQFGNPSKTETIPGRIYKQTVDKWGGDIAEIEIKGGDMTPGSFQIKSNAITREKIGPKGNLGF